MSTEELEKEIEVLKAQLNDQDIRLKKLERFFPKERNNKLREKKADPEIEKIKARIRNSVKS